MGFLQAIVIGSTSFLLGLVFVSQSVDIPLLYTNHLSPAALQVDLDNAYRFYEIWWAAPGAVKAVLHTAMAVPLVALIVKLNRWSESAVFFDGSSMVLQMSALILYLTVHVPYLRIFLPDSVLYPDPNNIPIPSGPLAFLTTPPRGTPPTEGERVEAVRVLAAGNALVGLCLLGVLAMQAGQHYAQVQDEREQRRVDQASRSIGSGSTKVQSPAAAPVVAGTGESKKTR